jgi:hypothetical protein
MSLLTKIGLFAATLVAALTPSSATLADCGLGKSVFKIETQGFSPDPPVPGQEYEYWFYYTVPEGVSVDAGTVKYSLTLNGIPFSPTVDDLCTQTFCPKTSGSYNETSKDVWPTGVSGKIVTKLEWFDTNSNLLLCSQVTEKM